MNPKHLLRSFVWSNNILAPRALAPSGRRPGVRGKRAARGVAGHQLWTGRREKTAHPSIAIMRRRQPALLVNGELTAPGCRIRRPWDGMVLVTK